MGSNSVSYIIKENKEKLETIKKLIGEVTASAWEISQDEDQTDNATQNGALIGQFDVINDIVDNLLKRKY